MTFANITASKVSVFGDFLVHIFPHSDQKNSEYGQVLRIVYVSQTLNLERASIRDFLFCYRKKEEISTAKVYSELCQKSKQSTLQKLLAAASR